VFLDGVPWRIVPADAAVRAGLAVGRPLDRAAARTLARELRRAAALGVAVRALRHRDLSRRRLEARLADETKNWKFRVGDLDDRRRWPEFTKAYHGILANTSTEWAPWYIVPADNKHVRNWLIARTIADTLESLKLRYPPGDPEIVGIKVE